MKVSRNPAAVHAALDDGSIILNVESGIYYGLDRVGTRIWELVGESAPEESIVAQLESEYTVEGDILRKDVAALLRHLRATGLVQVAAR